MRRHSYPRQARPPTRRRPLKSLRRCVSSLPAPTPGTLCAIASLYTDEFIRDFFGGVPREDLLDFLATPPQPLTDDQKRVIVRMGEVQLLPDGRAGVVIVLDEPDDPRSEEPDFVILERVEGRWLADEIHEDAGTTSTAADWYSAA